MGLINVVYYKICRLEGLIIMNYLFRFLVLVSDILRLSQLVCHVSKMDDL